MRTVLRGAISTGSQALTALSGRMKDGLSKVKETLSKGLSDTKSKMTSHADKAGGKAREAPAKSAGKISEGKAKVEAAAHKEPEKPKGLFGKILSAAKWVAEKLKAAFKFVVKLVSDPGFWVSLVVGIALAAFCIATFGTGLAALAIAGAVVGALSSGAGTIVSNLAAGKSWNEGLGMSMLMGAAGGVVFGPFGGRVAGAVGSSLAKTAGGRAVSAVASRVASRAGTVASRALAPVRSTAGRAAATRAGRAVTAIPRAAGRGVRLLDNAAANTGAAVRQRAGKLADRLRGARPGNATDDALRARPTRVTRQDNDFGARSRVDHKGVERPKSHLSDDGLRPADPNGTTTELQHIVGRGQAKDSSPWTSCASRNGELNPKVYGSQELSVDVRRLARDVERGRVPGVVIRTPAQIQSAMRDDLARVPGLDVDAGVAAFRDGGRDGLEACLGRLGLSNSARSRASTRLEALSNTTRDGEWLLKGTIPREYLILPGQNTRQAVGAAVSGSTPREPRGPMIEPSEHDAIRTDMDGNPAMFVDVMADGLDGDLDDRIPVLRRMCTSAPRIERGEACSLLAAWGDPAGLRALVAWSSTGDDELTGYTREFGFEPPFDMFAAALSGGRDSVRADQTLDLRGELARALLRVAHRFPMDRDLASALLLDAPLRERAADELRAAIDRSMALLEDAREHQRLRFDLWIQTAGLLGGLAKLDDARAAAIAERLIALGRGARDLLLEINQAMVAGRGPATRAVLGRLRESKLRDVAEDAARKLERGRQD